MKPPIELGGFTLVDKNYKPTRSVTKATKMVTPMLWPAGAVVRGPIVHLLEDLVRRHPWRDQIVGPGIDHFEVIEDAYGNCGYVACRVDGSRKPFSYGKGITGKDKSPAARLNEALRNEIFYQKPHKMPGVVAHHANPSFADIVGAWLAARGFDPAAIATENVPGKTGVCRLVDRGLANDWQSFHLARANWELVTTTEHKRLHSKRKPKA